MAKPKTIQVKLMGPPDTIQALQQALQASPRQAKIVSSGPVEDPTLLEFGLMDWAAVVAIVQATLYFGELSAMLYQHLQDNKDKTRRIVVQTPLGRAEFVPSKDLTPRQIQDALQSLASLHK